MRIAICDDDQTAADELASMLKEQEPSACLDVFYDPNALLAMPHAYDILFLDIDMPQMDGIQLGNEIRKKDKQVMIIYLTNMSEYRSMAFGVHAFDYIEKPACKDRIRHVLQEAKSYHKDEKPIITASFSSKEGRLRIPISEIIYFEFYNRHVTLHTTKQTYTLMTHLYKIKESLKEEIFLSPHKSFYINLEHVRLVKGYDIYMTNDDVIPLSQKKASSFRASLNQFLSRCLHEEDRP